MDNVEIKNPNGEIITAEVISYFEIIETGKRYVFYTKNEIVENGLVKMYVARVAKDPNSVTVEQQMSAEEWTALKNIMKAILTGSGEGIIKYLEIEGA